MMNMNSGYIGWSMSKRAAAAYEDGEMPKSKWTKAAMLAAIAETLDWYEIELTEEQMKNLEKMPKDRMFWEFFEYRGWHHTSKHCNRTEFYGPWEAGIVEAAKTKTFAVSYGVIAFVGSRQLRKEFATKRERDEYMKSNKLREPMKQYETLI